MPTVPCASCCTTRRSPTRRTDGAFDRPRLPPDAAGLDLSVEFGFVRQARSDMPLSDRGLGFSVEAKHYFVDTTATSRADSATALLSEHALDPSVISASVSWRFRAHDPEIENSLSGPLDRPAAANLAERRRE